MKNSQHKNSEIKNQFLILPLIVFSVTIISGFLTFASNASAATSIYRSVGVGATAPITTGASNAMTISGSTVAFASALPDNVGVGDAIQYDSDNNGSIDAIAFIHGRTDSQHYTVKKFDGSAPTATSSNDNDWGIYRAYTSLFNAEAGTENSGLDDAVENFDVWSGGKDITASDEQWNITCYGSDTADSTAVTIDGWTTSSTDPIVISTPTNTSQVGTNQRHPGKWDDTKYRLEISNPTAGTHAIDIKEDFVRVNGL